MFFNNNTLQQWLIALLIAILSLIVIRILRRIILHRLKAISERTTTDIDDLITDLYVGQNSSFCLLLQSMLVHLVLTLPQTLKDIISRIVVVAILAQGAV